MSGTMIFQVNRTGSSAPVEPVLLLLCQFKSNDLISPTDCLNQAVAKQRYLIYRAGFKSIKQVLHSRQCIGFCEN